MGKKGGAKKGKPVVMTQQEFFQQQSLQNSEPNYDRLFNQQARETQQDTGSWDKVDIFGQNKGKVVVAKQEPAAIIIPEQKEPVEEEKKVKPQPVIEEKKVEPKKEQKKSEPIKVVEQKQAQPLIDPKKFEEHRR